jgi:hypothetical protein
MPMSRWIITDATRKHYMAYLTRGELGTWIPKWTTRRTDSQKYSSRETAQRVANGFPMGTIGFVEEYRFAHPQNPKPGSLGPSLP